jgi:hypothetical protein
MVKIHPHLSLFSLVEARVVGVGTTTTTRKMTLFSLDDNDFAFAHMASDEAAVEKPFFAGRDIVKRTPRVIFPFSLSHTLRRLGLLGSGSV